MPSNVVNKHTRLKGPILSGCLFVGLCPFYVFAQIPPDKSATSNQRTQEQEVSACEVETELCKIDYALVEADHPDAQSEWHNYGDFRAGFYYTDAELQAGDAFNVDQLKYRIRIGFKGTLSENWNFRARLAGTYSSEFGDFDFYFKDHLPSGRSVAGDTTIDSLSATYRFNDKVLMEFGRMQTGFNLLGAAPKSLTRKDSNNVNVNWTDGVRLQYDYSDSWRWNLILQHNSDEGTSNFQRAPLNFKDSDAKVTIYNNFALKTRNFPLAQLEFDVVAIPDGLDVFGDQTKFEDYWAFSARGLYGLHRNPEKETLFMIGAELGYALNQPDKTATNTGSNGDAGGLAYQVSLNFRNFGGKGQHTAIVHGSADAGWLISPHFPSNIQLTEVRFGKDWGKPHRLEIRVRRRKEIDLETGAIEKANDIDSFVRYTYKF